MDSVKVVCPKCQEAYKLPAKARNRPLRCAKCRTVFRASVPDTQGADSSARSGEQASDSAESSAPASEDSDSSVSSRGNVEASGSGTRSSQASEAESGGPKSFTSHFPDAPPIGSVIGDCEIMELLGEGGMGIVYKAVRRTLKRIVALKVVPKSVAKRSPTYGPRLISEAQSAARLSHPGIVIVFNAGKDGDHVFMEMEFVPGQSLKSITKEGALSELEAIRIVKTAAGALGYAHDHGVVHRDIKPDNIMLTNDGIVKVADFGLAGNIWDRREEGLTEDAASVDPSLMKAGAIMGTAGYMSPQQCRGEPLDGRTDIYALGATFYALLCGHSPFKHPNPVIVLQKHQKEPVPDIRKLNSNVSDETWEVIQKAMAKELDDRYQSCQELIDALSAPRKTEGDIGQGGADQADDFMASFAKMLSGVKKDKS